MEEKKTFDDTDPVFQHDLDGLYVASLCCQMERRIVVESVPRPGNKSLDMQNHS